jgi:uncharacterized protein (DUF1330 family)
VTDPVAYKRYTDRIPEIMKKYGGEILSRGARYETLEGPDHFNRFVLIQFESLEAKTGLSFMASSIFAEALVYSRPRPWSWACR